MSAEDEIRRQMVRLEAMTNDVFIGVGTEALQSIQEGSALTAAPGQPVDTGALRASWQRTFDSPTQQTIGTNLEYAEAVEDAVGRHGPVTYGAAGHGRSTVGGSHSVKLTVAGMPRIVEAVTEQVVKGQGFTNERSGFTGEDGG